MKIIFLLLGIGLADDSIPTTSFNEEFITLTITINSSTTDYQTHSTIPPIVTTTTTTITTTTTALLSESTSVASNSNFSQTKTASQISVTTTTVEAIKKLPAQDFLKSDQNHQFSAQNANTNNQAEAIHQKSTKLDSVKLNGLSAQIPVNGDQSTNESTGQNFTWIALSCVFGICILAVGGFIISKKQEPLDVIETGFQSHETMDSRPKHLSKLAFGYFGKYVKTSNIPFSNESAHLSVSTMESYCPPPALITRSNTTLNSPFLEAATFYNQEQDYVLYEKDDHLSDFKRFSNVEIRNSKYDSHDFQVSPFTSLEEEHDLDVHDHDAAYLAAAASFAASQDSQGSESKYDSMMFSDDDGSDFSSFISSDY